MDIFLLIGVVMGIFSVVVGMIVKGADVAVLFNPAAAIIIIVGTIAAVVNSFPKKDMGQIPKIFKVLINNKTNYNPVEIVNQIIELAQVARRGGVLSIESAVQNLTNPFLKNGLEMVVDGMDPEHIRDILEIEIEGIEERHHIGSTIFKTAGASAPTLGVLGAVIGLIGALGNLNDVNALGHMISAAFVATLYGIFFGYVMFKPFASRLERKSQEEIKSLTIIVEGVLSIQAGNNPKTIEKKLIGMLEPAERQQFTNPNT